MWQHWSQHVSTYNSIRARSQITDQYRELLQQSHERYHTVVTTIPVPLAPHNVREVHPNVPTGAPARTSDWYKECGIAVTDDPESTRNSTAWSPIHPSRNQSFKPDICRSSSSTWSPPAECELSKSGPVCVGSIRIPSHRSDIARLSSPVYRASVGPVVSWLPNRMTNLSAVSTVGCIVEWDKSENDVCSDGSVDEDELMSRWIAFRPVWVRPRSKWHFPVVNYCFFVVEHASDCMFQPGGLNGSVTSGFGQRACVCPIWPQLKHLILEKSRPWTGGKRRTWAVGSRRLVRSASNQSHLIPHLLSKGKHLGQRRRHVRLRNTLSRPLRAIHHGEHLVGTLVLFHREGLLSRSVYVTGRAEAGKIRAHLNQCLELPILLGTNPINTFLAPGLTAPAQIVHWLIPGAAQENFVDSPGGIVQ